MKKTGLFLVLIVSLVLGLVAVPGFAGASDVNTSAEASYQPLSCANGLPAIANYNARIRRYASITAAAYPVVIPDGTLLPAVAMDHTGGWLLVCFAGIVGWSSRDLYTPGADWVVFQTLPILGADMSSPPPRQATDRDGDGYFDYEDYCPDEAAGYLPGSAAERQRPYTGCPHADALTQCILYSGTGTCVNLINGVVPLMVYDGSIVNGTCMFVDTDYSIPALGEGCWVPVIAKAFGNTQLVVEAVSAESTPYILAGLKFQGWAQTEQFGPVSGDLAKVPSY